MNETIFRAEAIAHQNQRLLGAVIIAQPVSLKVLTLLIALGTAGVFLFLITNDYTRRQNVSGYLVPTRGVVAVFPSAGGLLAELYAEEGDFVEQGSDLFKMQIDRKIAGETYISEEILQQLQEQKLRLTNAIQLEDESLASLLERQRISSGKLELDIAALNAQIKTQTALYQIEQNSLRRARKLLEEGVIAQSDMDKVEQNHLERHQQLNSLQASVANKKLEREENPVIRSSYQTDSSKKISELENRVSELDRQIATAEVEQINIIRAPVSGTITALSVSPGQNIDSSMPVVTIIPRDSQLYANLYVPTRAIGFIEEGQHVRLRYEAFPYQRFGLYEGCVEQVTNSVLDPRELPEALPIKEPVYRVRVALTQQKIVAYGQDVLLKPGMLLSADIELDKRSLFEWLLEPLYSLKGKL